jgi:hypothetical protein
MAELPPPVLTFEDSCRQCARRDVLLPTPLPPIADDFDWLVRDFEGFRRFMLEDLAARFPERTRWTAADLEVVIIEAFAAVLDQLSDMLDRVAAEGTLETARRPDSVRRLLAMIGYDALRAENAATPAELHELWEREPARMEAARRAGPRAVHQQRRLVSLADFGIGLEQHPLVNRAQAALVRTGSADVVQVAVTLLQDQALDESAFAGAPDPARLRADVEAFHRERNLPPLAEFPNEPSCRMLLHACIERQRMLGQQVKLLDAEVIGIELSLSIRVRGNYFQSEVRHEVERVLGRGPTGFFRPGRLRFGEDLHIADVIQVVMALDGVENVCVNRFKRLGRQFPDQSANGGIVLSGLEIAVCDNDVARPGRGYFRLRLHGGRAG